MESLIASLGALLIGAFGFYVLIGGPRRWGWGAALGGRGEHPRSGPSPIRESVNALATVGVTFEFFANSATTGVISQDVAAVAILGVLVGLAILPELQLLVGLAALAVLFIERGSLFTTPLLGAFVLGGLAHILLRRLIGR